MMLHADAYNLENKHEQLCSMYRSVHTFFTCRWSRARGMHVCIIEALMYFIPDITVNKSSVSNYNLIVSPVITCLQKANMSLVWLNRGISR